MKSLLVIGAFSPVISKSSSDILQFQGCFRVQVLKKRRFKLDFVCESTCICTEWKSVPNKLGLTEWVPMWGAWPNSAPCWGLGSCVSGLLWQRLILPQRSGM